MEQDGSRRRKVQRTRREEECKQKGKAVEVVHRVYASQGRIKYVNKGKRGTFQVPRLPSRLKRLCSRVVRKNVNEGKRGISEAVEVHRVHQIL